MDPSISAHTWVKARQAGSDQFLWGDHPAVYVTGAVRLDAIKLGKELAHPQGNLRVQAVILHEIGHLVGLDHVNDQAELMYLRGGTLTDSGPGDLTGLATLGNGTCAPWL
jgi:hypothetical protein